MISREIRRLLKTDSAIREMWTHGCELKRIHGAERVADMTLGNPSIDKLVDRDPMLDRETLGLFRDAYLAGADPATPTASPLHAQLEGLPPLLLQVGRAEVLLGEVEDLAARARAAGVDVTLQAWDDMIHVWQTFADLLPEGREAIADIGKFVDARL